MTSLIYFASDGGRAIKVGVSSKIGLRLRHIQTVHAGAIELIDTTPGTFKHEAAIHRKLADHRLNGEWYVDCVPVREIVNLLLRDGVGSLEIKYRHRRSDNPDEFVSEAVKICNELVGRERNKGLTIEQAVENVGRLTGIGRSRIWHFRYRPPFTIRAFELSALRNAISGALNAS